MKTKSILALLACVALSGCGGGQKADVKVTTTKPEDKPAPAPAPASSYQGGAVSDGGSISGTVTYAGSEQPSTIKPTTDHEACGPATEAKPAGDLVVKDGKLANVVVYIDGITRGKDYSPSAVTIDNENCMFKPHVAIGHVGQNIVAKNSDPVMHNTHLKLAANGRDGGNIALPPAGQAVEKQLRTKGLTNVTCDAHDWMKAYLYVTDNPYATVTDEDGKFKFDDVPAGTYTVRFWHERMPAKEASATVAAGSDVVTDVAF